MPTLIVKEHPNEDELRKLRKLREQGYYVEYLDNLGRPVKITIEMYRDLETTDLFEIFDPADNRFAMAHGAEDEIIKANAAIEFATKFRIPLTLFEGEGHSLSGIAEQVADLAIELYNG